MKEVRSDWTPVDELIRFYYVNKNFSSELKDYLEKQFYYLISKNKGFSGVQNIHVYANRNEDKVNENLICYLDFNWSNNTINVSNCLKNAQISDAHLFPLLGIPRYSKFDLSTYSGLLAFDQLITKISEI